LFATEKQLMPPGGGIRKVVDRVERPFSRSG